MTTDDAQPDVLKKDQHIKLPILAPLFATILMLLIIFTFGIYNLQKQHIKTDISNRIESARRAFHLTLAEDARLLGSTAEIITGDPRIQSAWLAKDRSALLGCTAPLLEKFHNNYNVTHLYFIDAGNTCFLRVHNPPRFGDRIDRFTLLSAAKTKKTAWGIELGPYGTFTLRRVQPWFVNDSLAGFVEVGEETEHIIPKLKDMFGVDLVVFIQKSLLDRQSWEEGQKMMGRIGDWERLADFVISDSTTSFIPPDFIKYAEQDGSALTDRVLSSTYNGSTYSAGFIRLFDAAGAEVGKILVVKNVSRNFASLRALFAIVAVLCLLLAAILVFFFYFHINTIQNRLIETHSALVSENEKRKIVEDELRRNRDNLEYIVNVRTAELEKTNTQLKQEVTQRTKAEHSLEKLNADLETTVSQLIRSNRQLREFAHITAHDLKTPLRGIGTLTQWLLTDYYDKFDDNGRKQLDLLIKRIWRVDKIMNIVLQYSTIARNKHNEHNVDLDKLLKEVIPEVKPPQNIKITVEKHLPESVCDEKLIYHVFYNLIDNAVKFNDKSDGHVTIDCEDEKNFWKFSVGDNGPGIKRRHFDRIFRLFQTLSDDPDETLSVGAGLTIARKIVELYDGKIWLTSEPGRGTTFYFTWPKTPAPAGFRNPLFATAK